MDAAILSEAYRVTLQEHLAALAGEVGLAPATLQAYSADLHRAALYFEQVGAKSWLQVTPDLLVTYLSDLRKEGFAAASLVRHLSSLRGLYRLLKVEGRLPQQDPTQFAGKVHLWQRLPDVLSPEECLALLDAPKGTHWMAQRDRALLALLYGGGLRASEATQLQLPDLSFHDSDGHPQALLRVLGKGSKERLVPLGGLGLERLHEWLSDGRKSRPHPEAWVLLSKGGRFLDRIRIYRLVQAYAQKSGMGRPVHPHMLRHSCATHLLAGGGDMRSVQEFLGHADLQTTERYTHVEEAELKAYHRLHHPRG